MAVALGIVGAVVSAAGTLVSGMGAANAASFQAKIAANNAQIAQNNAAYERQKGSIDAQNQDLKNKAVIGQLMSEQGASGLDFGSGSFKEARSSSAALGRLDTLNVKNDADRRAVNFQNQAQNFTAESQMQKSAASNNMLGAFIGAGSSLIGGISSTADKWAGYKAAGI